MNAPIAIRPANHGDIDNLVALARSTFRDTYAHIDDPADIEDYVTHSFTHASFTAILADAKSNLLLATDSSRAVGYLHMQRSGAPDCVTGPAPIELARIYLRRDVQGAGLGTRLMREAVGIAKRELCQTVWLGVYIRNEPARNFYGRYGFVDVGTKDFMFGGKIYADPIMAASVTTIEQNLLVARLSHA